MEKFPAGGSVHYWRICLVAFCFCTSLLLPSTPVLASKGRQTLRTVCLFVGRRCLPRHSSSSSVSSFVAITNMGIVIHFVFFYFFVLSHRYHHPLGVMRTVSCLHLPRLLVVRNTTICEYLVPVVLHEEISSYYVLFVCFILFKSYIFSSYYLVHSLSFGRYGVFHLHTGLLYCTESACFLSLY